MGLLESRVAECGLGTVPTDKEGNVWPDGARR